MNDQTAGTSLQGDKPQGSQGQPVIRLEIVEETALGTVRQDFIMDVQEDFRRQHFHLEAHLVVQAMS